MGAEQSRSPSQARRATYTPHDPLQTLLRELRSELGLVNQFASAEQRARAASTGSAAAARDGIHVDTRTPNDPGSSGAWRQEGNRRYRLGAYKSAIEAYDQAVALNARSEKETGDQRTHELPLVNRALCKMKLNRWAGALDDAGAALRINPDAIKAKYIIGKVCIETGQLDKARAYLTDAWTSIQSASSADSQANASWGAPIKAALFALRRREFERARGDGSVEELRARLVRLLGEEERQEMDGVRVPSQSRRGTSAKKKKEKMMESIVGVSEAHAKRVELLNQVFQNTASSESRRELPEAFLCGISYCLMTDPVITPSGHSYDRSSIMRHLKEGGQFDPMTRGSLTAAQLVPNLALREAIEQFIEENPWAYEETDG